MSGALTEAHSGGAFTDTGADVAFTGTESGVTVDPEALLTPRPQPDYIETSNTSFNKNSSVIYSSGSNAAKWML